jgi:methyltransferase, FkbM family
MDSLLKLLQSAAHLTSGVIGRDSWTIRRARPIYEFVLAAFAPSAAVPWSVNGDIYRIDPRFRHMFGHTYESAVASFLRQNVRPGDVCFDIGANVGVYVLQLGRWTSETGKVVAFEPNPAARRVLERHVTLNGLAQRVTTVDCAIADTPGDRLLYSVGENGMARLESPSAQLASSATGLPVSVTSLDAFVSRTGLEPRWIVMDIEGFEVQALLGARSLIRRLRGRLGWVVEMHPGAWPSIGVSRDILESLISELGLTLRPLTGQEDALAEYGHVLIS